MFLYQDVFNFRINYLVFGVKEWVQDIQCVQLSSVVSDAPPVWREHHIVGISLQVLANASVLEIQARELCMGHISADFSGISRVHLPRPPWLPPMLEVVRYHMEGVAGNLKHIPKIVLWVCSRNEPLPGKCGITCISGCISGNHSVHGLLVKWRFRFSSAKGQGEQHVCSGGRSVEVQCSTFCPRIMSELVQYASINILELPHCNVLFILEVTLWMNN
jgi:hypothetical protein